MTHVKTKIDLFGITVVLVLGKYDIKAFTEEVNAATGFTLKPPKDDILDDEEQDHEGNARCWDFHQVQVIWMEEFNIPLLAHELSHAIQFSTDNLGIDDKGGEVPAYMMEWCIREFIRIIEG